MARSEPRARSLLITGISGYVGQGLARHSRQFPFTTIIGTYFSTRPEAAEAVDLRLLDVRDETAVNELWAEVQPQVVIHTAADFRHPEHLVDSICEGTRNVAAASARHAARLVHLSSDVIFDGEHAPYRESGTPAPLTPYARAKAEAETLVAAAGLSSYVIVRTSLVMGLHPIDPRTAWVWDSVRQGLPITLFTDEFRCPIWVDDLAQALLELAAADFQGYLHVAGPQRLSRYELGVRLCRYAGLDPGALTAGLVRESGLVRPRDCTLDITLARRLLRTPLRSLDEGLAQGR